jgi:hypothetical protein
MTPEKQLTNATIKSSVKKYPKSRSFGQPAAFISPMSLVRCDIIMKAMKETITMPTTRTRIPRSTMKGEKTNEKPEVNLPSTANEMPNPILAAKRRRKSVEATHNDKPVMTRPV